MLEQPIEEQQLELSISHKIFPLPVIEKVLFLLRHLIESFEVTNTSADNIKIRIATVSRDTVADIEDLFYSRLISTVVSLRYGENNRDIKQCFLQTAGAVMIEPQQVLKRRLVAWTRETSQSQTNRVVYWNEYKGYRVELGGGLDLFVEEEANIFHLDLDDSLYSASDVQRVVEKVITDSFRCAIRTETSRIIISVTFQEGTAQPVMLKALLDLHKNLRTFG